MDWFKCPKPTHYDGPGSSCPVCDGIQHRRYQAALEQILKLTEYATLADAKGLAAQALKD